MKEQFVLCDVKVQNSKTLSCDLCNQRGKGFTYRIGTRKPCGQYIRRAKKNK